MVGSARGTEHQGRQPRRIRALSTLLALGLGAGTLAAVATPAAAVGAACASGMTAQSGLTVAPVHDSAFYIDTGFDASYLGYKVTNTGTSRTNLWVQVGSFAGGVVALADPTDDRQQIATLAGGASDSAFYLVKASGATAVDQTHVVTVYDRRPDLAGATSLLSCTFTFTDVSTTIEAAANKVTAITATPASPAIGQTVSVAVAGKTGQATGAMWVSPAALSTWPSKALRLENTKIEVDIDGNGTVDSTYTDTLLIPSAEAALFGSSTTYLATYTFRLTRPTATNPTVKPVAQIYSGGAFKHTGSYPTLPTIASSSAATAVTVTKTMTAADTSTLPTTTSPNGTPGATTYVEVPFRITATSVGGTSVVDEMVDVAASGVLFRSGSAVLVDDSHVSGAAIADPVTSPSDTGVRSGARHFTGPFYASVAHPATVSYVMYVPITAGTYTNQAFATINGTTIGSTPSTVPIVSVTTNGTGVTGTTTGSTGAGVTPQTLSFTQPADMTALTGTQTLVASATSGLAVTFTSTTPAVCTVSGSTVTPLTSGSCTITATQAGDATYSAATPVTRTLTVSQHAQTITFPQPSAMTMVDAAQGLSATATSTLAVQYESTTPAVCTVGGGSVSVVGAGTCSITATQPGDGTYLAAAPVIRTFTVSRVDQTITFAAPDGMTLGGLDQPLTVAASSGLDVVLTPTDPTICTVTAGVVAAVVGGTCEITATQPGDATYLAAAPVVRSLTIVAPGTAPQRITFVQPDDAVMTDSPLTVNATASSSLEVTVTSSTPAVCTVVGTTVTLVGPGTCSLVAHQDGDAVYAAAPDVERSFTVARLLQSITFVQHGDVLMTASPVTVNATASSDLGVTVTSSDPSVCTVDGLTVTLVGAGTCVLLADQEGDADYEPAAQTGMSFEVGLAPQSITFAQPADVVATDGTVTLTASASSELALTLTSSTPGVCAVDGTTVTILASGDCTIVASQPGTTVYAAADEVTRTFAVTPAVQLITFVQPGDILMTGSPSLTATSDADLGVTLTSETPLVCTIDASGVVTPVSAGDCTVTASQPGTALYAAADDVSRTFAIARAPQVVDLVVPIGAALDESPVTVSASTDSPLVVAVGSTTPEVCTVDGTTVTLLTTGTCTLVASQAGDGTWLPAADVTRSFPVRNLGQVITFPAIDDVDVDSAGVVPAATTDAALLSVRYESLTPDVCTVAQDGEGAWAITVVDPGTCTVRALQDGDVLYAPAAPVDQSFDVRALARTISADQPGDALMTDGTVTLVASLTGGGAPTARSLTPEVCDVADGLVVALLAPGTCEIELTADAGGWYLAAQPVTLSFDVALAPLSIGLDQPADTVVDEGPVPFVATSSRDAAPVLVSLTPEVCTVGDGVILLLAPGTCTVSLSDDGAGLYEPAGPVTRSFEVLAPLAVGTPTMPTPRPGDPVSVPVPASGGVGPYGYSVESGSLPDGVVLDPSTGVIAGAPTTPGTYVFTVRVLDADGRSVGTQLVLVVTDTSAKLPALSDGTGRMKAGATWTTPLPTLPGSGTWEVVAPAGVFTTARVVDGALRLTASASRSGVHPVVVVAHLGDLAARGTWTITVVPQAPRPGTFRLTTGLRTTVAWGASPNASVHAYRLYVGGRLVATTTSRKVTLVRPLGPSSVVTVRAVGASSVRSAPRALHYRRPARPPVAAIGLDVYFAVDSTVLTAAARRELRAVAVVARSHGFTHLRLVGHTDDRASYAYNLGLSQRRAAAVLGWLAPLVPRLALSRIGYSEARPVADNRTAEGRAHNRRVDVQLW